MHATPCHAARVEPAADSVLWCSARGAAALRCLACKLTPLARPRMDGAVLAAIPSWLWPWDRHTQRSADSVTACMHGRKLAHGQAQVHAVLQPAVQGHCRPVCTALGASMCTPVVRRPCVHVAACSMTMIDMHTILICTHSEHQPNPPCPPMQPSRRDARMHACVHGLASSRFTHWPQCAWHCEAAACRE
jgi:hypothetical protein